MRFSCVGAVKVSVTRCSFTRRSHAVGSNLRSTTIVPPTACANSANESGPEWYSGPVVRCTRRAVEQVHRLHERRAIAAGVGAGAHRTLGFPGGARRVDHRGAGALPGAGLVGHVGRRRLLRRDDVVPVDAARPARRRRTRAPARTLGNWSRTDATSGACSASTSTTVASELSITYCISAALNRYDTGTDVSADLAGGVERR